MADNYLERRMEEYRNSRTAGSAATRQARPLRPGQAIIDYPRQRILITDAVTPFGQDLIRTFRRLNCNVSITAADARQGTALAQQTGAKYHPGTPADALKWLQDSGDPAVAIIDTTAMTVTLCADGLSETAAVDRRAIMAGPEAVASWCAFALHPANRWIFT